MAAERRCPRWIVRLLGRFALRVGDVPVDTLPGRRTKELLGYLLLFRERPHHREVLAGTLWPDSDTAQSRKYLRQSLWQLRALDPAAQDTDSIVDLQTDWVELRRTDVWLDVAELEQAFAPVRLLPGEEVTCEQAQHLRRVVSLYRGDLLEGCYHDWCIFERERLKSLYISLLEKLLGHCETNGLPEEGLSYGEELLRHDLAHERAHARLMRLHYLAGNRTGALRQFERCRQALDEELGVTPGDRITRLYEQIRADSGIEPRPRSQPAPPPPARGPRIGVPPLEEALRALTQAEDLVRQSLRATRNQDR